MVTRLGSFLIRQHERYNLAQRVVRLKKSSKTKLGSLVTMASFRDEFRLQKLFLNYPSRKPFTTSPWLPLAWFTLYRGVLCIFCSAVMLQLTIRVGRGYSLAFTTWSFAVVTFYFVCAFLLSAVELYGQWRSNNNLRKGIGEKEDPLQIENKAASASDKTGNKIEAERPVPDTNGLTNKDDEAGEFESRSSPELVPAPMTIAHKLQWLLFNVAANNAIIVTLGYWSLLFPRMASNTALVEGESGFINITVHLLNSVLMLMEIFMSALPVRLLHVIYAVSYGIVYLLMTLVRWLITKEYIYYFLDFNRPGLAVGFIFLLLLVVQPLVQLLYYGLYSLRVRLERRLGVRDGSSRLSPC